MIKNSKEGDTFPIQGSGIAKGNRTITSYLWSEAYLDHRDSAIPIFTAPAYQGNTDNYTLILTVTDSTGITSKVSTVHYTVISSGNPKLSLQGYQTTSPVVVGAGRVKLTANTQKTITLRLPLY